jgi:hypothetical protein
MGNQQRDTEGSDEAETPEGAKAGGPGRFGKPGEITDRFFTDSFVLRSLRLLRPLRVTLFRSFDAPGRTMRRRLSTVLVDKGR